MVPCVLALRLPGGPLWRDTMPVHSLPFSKFATNEAIQRTEAYEYAQSLGAQACSPPSFQVGPDSSVLLGVGLVSVHKAVAITGFIQRNKKRETGLEISRRS